MPAPKVEGASCLYNEREGLGTSLVVQWLRHYLSVQGVWVQSLVRELRFHMTQRKKPKTCNRSNVVTNSTDFENGLRPKKKKT